MSLPLRLALSAAVVLALVALGPYFWTFNGELSRASQEWSNFGSYLGGTLGPIYALMAFAVGVQTILDNRQQNVRQSLLTAIQRYEADFEAACIRTVTCENPWVWGRLPGETSNVHKVSLRTLLHSDSIDWEQHLSPLITGHGFQVLPSGEISQDREVVLSAQLALEGLFKYLNLYMAAHGDQALIAYLELRYEIPRNRISAACEIASHSMEADAQPEVAADA